MYPECSVGACLAGVTIDYPEDKIYNPYKGIDPFWDESNQKQNKRLKSKYNKDIEFTNIVLEYNKLYFYPRMFPDDKYEKDFIEDETRQKLGIDVIIRNKLTGEITYIDEKVNGHYINSPIKTATFETASGKDNTKGWILRNDLFTNYYLIQWVQADFKRYPPTKVYNIGYDPEYYTKVKLDGIENIVSCLVSKKDIQNFYYQLGYSLEKIYELSLKLKESGERSYVDGLFDLRYSGDRLQEHPVNLRVYMNTLQSISTQGSHTHCFTTNKNYVKVVDSLKQAYLGLFPRGV